MYLVRFLQSFKFTTYSMNTPRLHRETLLETPSRKYQVDQLVSEAPELNEAELQAMQQSLLYTGATVSLRRVRKMSQQDYDQSPCPRKLKRNAQYVTASSLMQTETR
jgi:hypothetical protein